MTQAYQQLNAIENTKRSTTFSDVINKLTFGLTDWIGITDTAQLDLDFAKANKNKLMGVRNDFLNQVKGFESDTGKNKYIQHFSAGNDQYSLVKMPGSYYGDLRFAKEQLARTNGLIDSLTKQINNGGMLAN